MPIKTNIPDYKINVFEIIDTKSHPGLYCMVDTKENLICIDDRGENIIRENPKAEDDADRFFRGSISEKINELGDRELTYKVNGEIVTMSLFEALLAAWPPTSDLGVSILNGDEVGNPKVVLDEPFLTTATGLGFKLDVRMGNLKVVSRKELLKYKSGFNEKQEEVQEEVSENAQNLYEMTGDNIWSADLENFIAIKITGIELYESNFKIPDFDIKGLPNKNRTIIIPRLYKRTLNASEIITYFKSFVPEINIPSITKKSALSSFSMRIKLKGVHVSYNTDVVEEDGKLAIHRNRRSEERIVEIDKGLTIDFKDFKKIIINNQVFGEKGTVNPPTPVYLNRPSERDYSEIEGYRSSRDIDKENVIRRRAETKFLGLSDDDKDKVILSEYLKKLGKKTTLPIDTLLDRTINNYMKVSKNLTPTAEEEAERLIRAQKLAAEVDRKAKEAEVAERKRMENVIKTNESIKKEADSLAKEEALSKNIAKEGRKYDFKIS